MSFLHRLATQAVMSVKKETVQRAEESKRKRWKVSRSPVSEDEAGVRDTHHGLDKRSRTGAELELETEPHQHWEEHSHR